MTKTPNLSIDLIHPNQSQKELTINEALTIIDSVLNNSIININVNNIPLNPASGDLYHIGDSATGEWENYLGHMAVYTDGGWRYFMPRHGFIMWSNAHDSKIVYKQGAWVIT